MAVSAGGSGCALAKERGDGRMSLGVKRSPVQIRQARPRLARGSRTFRGRASAE